MSFEPFPKIPRLRRDMVITEKIDGTNACINVRAQVDEYRDTFAYETSIDIVVAGGDAEADVVKVAVSAQSRKRIVTPEDDNFGFARWVHENAGELATILGPGRHFGEWWGSGIQRTYNLDHKRFSLFNINRWSSDGKTPLGEIVSLSSNGLYRIGSAALSVVPVLDRYTFDTKRIEGVVSDLRRFGSHAVYGYDRPEGVIVYHVAAGQLFKRLLEDDDLPKGLVEA